MHAHSSFPSEPINNPQFYRCLKLTYGHIVSTKKIQQEVMDLKNKIKS
jgi:hypothetical protein